MRRIEYSSTFKKDYKRSLKRGLNMKKFNTTLALLMNNELLPPKNRPHLLSGEWAGFRECHLAPDWLLIYDLENKDMVTLHRMGTHSDLFE